MSMACEWGKSGVAELGLLGWSRGSVDVGGCFSVFQICELCKWTVAWKRLLLLQNSGCSIKGAGIFFCCFGLVLGLLEFFL